MNFLHCFDENTHIPFLVSQKTVIIPSERNRQNQLNFCFTQQHKGHNSPNKCHTHMYHSQVSQSSREQQNGYAKDACSTDLPYCGQTTAIGSRHPNSSFLFFCIGRCLNCAYACYSSSLSLSHSHLLHPPQPFNPPL